MSKDFYPFDQPIYRITQEKTEDAEWTRICELPVEQLLLSRDLSAEARAFYSARTQENDLDVLAEIPLNPEDNADTLIEKIRACGDVTGVVLCCPASFSSRTADSLADEIREKCDIAIAVAFSDLPGEDPIPENTCIYPLYRTAYRRHLRPASRLDFNQYAQVLDAMQEADHLLSMGSLPQSLLTLRAQDCGRYPTLPMKALLMLHMTLTGTPVLSQGEEYGYGTLSAPESITAGLTPASLPSAADQWSDPDSVYAWTRDLLALRREIPALSEGGYQLLQMDRAFAFARIDEEAGQAVIVAINYGASRVRMPGSADVILSSYNRSFFDGTLLPYEAAILEAFPEDEDEEEEED